MQPSAKATSYAKQLSISPKMEIFKYQCVLIALCFGYLIYRAKELEKDSYLPDGNQNKSIGKFWLHDSAASILWRIIASIILIYFAFKIYDPTSPQLSLLIIPPLLITGMLWVGPIFENLTEKFFRSLYGFGDKIENKPKYNPAESKWKSGRPKEAIKLIEEQLAEFPEDFEGQMLKAQIQMESLKDFASAEATLLEISSQKKHNAGKIALVLNQLADWYLKKDDKESTKKILMGLCARYPKTQIEFNCSQRLARMDFAIDSTDKRDASELVSLCLKQLDQHPLDCHTREQLARIYFNRYDKPDLAWEEMNKLFSNPFQHPRDITRWLNLMADWHLKRNNPNGARACLEQIISRYPDLPYAEEADNRLTKIRHL